MVRGFIYLAAVVDWATCRILACRVSITLDAGFCVETMVEALAKHSQPEIFNSDQGSQFTSIDLTTVLAARQVKTSMDDKGARRDKVFVKGLRPTIKHEKVFFRAYASVSRRAQGSAATLFGISHGRIKLDPSLCDERRPHSSLDRRSPDQA